jgi:hypothetical protein
MCVPAAALHKASFLTYHYLLPRTDPFKTIANTCLKPFNEVLSAFLQGEKIRLQNCCFESG